MLRNVWYEGNTLHSPAVAGEGSWGRDTTGQPGWFMGIVDSIGFVWKYKAAGAGAFATSAWTEVARLAGNGVLSLAGKSLTLSGNLGVEAASAINQDLTTDAGPTFDHVHVSRAYLSGSVYVDGGTAARADIYAVSGILNFSGANWLWSGHDGTSAFLRSSTSAFSLLAAGGGSVLTIAVTGMITPLVGEYQTQSGAWAAPSGGTNGRMVTVYNSTAGASRLYVYSNGAWRYVGLT
jgi:hypothetical protein